MNEQNGSHANEEQSRPAAEIHSGSQQRYVLTEAERRHIATAKTQVENLEMDVLKLKGAIYDRQQELALLRRHLTMYVGALVDAAGLPPGSVLSVDDGTIIARRA
jgi:hypothetical protein